MTPNFPSAQYGTPDNRSFFSLATQTDTKLMKQPVMDVFTVRAQSLVALW